MRRLLWLLALPLLPACMELGATSSAPTEEESSSPTATLGKYEVTATLKTQSCGTGSLELPETLAFVVELSSDGEDVLTWGEGGLALTGKRDPDGLGFSVTTASIVDARAGSTDMNLPPCRIERADAIDGELDQAEEPEAFTANLEITYDPEAGSDCRDLLFGPDRLVQALPCKAKYSLKGDRK
jgi:hypothetical protein